MHNWEHYRRLPAYFLMATLLASCGGGGDIFTLNGQSPAEITAPTKTSAGLQTSSAVSIQLKENGVALALQPVTLQVSGTAILSKASVVTDAKGIATFLISGNKTAEKGTITVTYTDSSNNVARQTIAYEIVDGSSKDSLYTLESTTTNNIVIPTSGQTVTPISVILKDESGQTAPKDQVVEFTLASNVAGVGRLSAASAKTDENGKATVSVDGLNQIAGDNFLIASYLDHLGSRVTKSIPFRVVNQFEVLLTVPSNELRTGGDFVALTATVFNASQSLVKNAKVSFQILSNEPVDGGTERCSQNAADSQQFKPVPLSKSLRGTIAKNDILTDDNGQATTTFSVTDNHNGNRRIVVTVDDKALVDKPLDCVDLVLSGTKIAVDPTLINTSAGQKNKITATVKNGKGLGVKGALVEFSGGGITTQTQTTGDEGTASIDALTFVSDSVVSAKSADLGLVAETKVAVSASGLKVFFVDNADVEITEGDIGSTSNIFVKMLTKASTKKVKFITTLGAITEPLLDDDLADGIAKAKISSPRPGAVRVDVVEINGATQTVVGHGEFRFVSSIPSKINLQADQSTLKPKGQALIEAEVLDVNDNPVKGALVEFHRDKDQSNGELSIAAVLTDPNGKAQVTFTAGASDTGKDAVIISAVIKADANHPEVKPVENVKLTVGGEALFISIAAGKTLLVVDDTTYAYPLSVAITDAVGHPVADRNVSIQVIPTRYFKGKYAYNDFLGLWFLVGLSVNSLFVPPVGCPNEDVNGNGILDKGEDTNNDGLLEPGNPVTIVGSLITNDAGRASFNLQYGKSFSNWLEVKVIASSEVSGSESRAERVFVLPVLGADITDAKTAPPGGTTSEYGLPIDIRVQDSNGFTTGLLSGYNGTELMTTLEDATPKLYSPLNSCATKESEAPTYFLKR